MKTLLLLHIMDSINYYKIIIIYNYYNNKSEIAQLTDQHNI